jgi:LPS-assembly protein
MRRASRHVPMRETEFSSTGCLVPSRLRLTRIARAVSLALLPLLTPLAAHADEGLQLHLQNSLIDPRSHPSEDTPTFGIADQIYGTNEVDTTLVGNAEVRRASGIIKGDYIHYDQVGDELFAQGSVRLFRDNNTYLGPELRLRLDDYQGFFVAPDYYLWSNQGRGFADRINFLSRQQSTMIEPIYTTCPPGDYEWYMTADSMDIDQNVQQGTGHNATVYFQGVPILTSPYLSFPLTNARRSGFLPPTFSATSTSGFEFLLPYYWNIAPNRDMTVYTDVFSRRGLQESADFRFIEPTYKGDFRIEGMNDQETDTFRYSLLAQGNWAGTGALSGFSALINYQAVSDANYFVDFSRSLAAASTRTLPRDLELTYSSTYWNLTVRALRYQTLQIPDSQIAVPYDKVPEFELHAARLDVGGFDFGLTGFATRFETIGAVGGDRFVLNPYVSYPLVGAGWFVTPKLSYNTTSYSLTDQAPGVPNSFNRNVPSFSLDSGLIFQRNTNLFDNNYQQTLEPRLFYVYRPYRNQSQLPDFDSGLPDFNFSQLFAENAFTGYDRLADENQLTAALTTRLLNPDNGAELFRASLGARYYLSAQNVTVPGINTAANPLVPYASLTASNPVPAGSTDLLALVSGQLTPTVALDSGIDYARDVGGVERSDFGVRYTPGTNKELGVDYRYLRGQFHQYDFTGEYPLWKNWYGVGRVNYSTSDHKLVEGLGGLEYRGCCWVVRFAVQQFVTGATTSTTTFFVQLELNGFSQIGTNPLDALRRNISGYTPIVQPVPDESPFDHYE